jgi:hypothetical protein
VAAHQKGAVNTRAWIVFLDESGVSLLPQIRRTYSPRGRIPLLRHRLNWKRASMAGALGYHSTDPDRGARLCFHLKPGSYGTAALIEVLEQMKVFCRCERVVLVWDGLSAHWSRVMRAWVARTGLAHPGTITRLRSRAQPGGTAVVLAARHPPHQHQPPASMVIPRPYRPDHPPTTPTELTKRSVTGCFRKNFGIGTLSSGLDVVKRPFRRGLVIATPSGAGVATTC